MQAGQLLTIFRAFLGKLMENQKEVAGKLAVVEQAVKLTFKTFCIPDDMVMFKRVNKVVMSLVSSVTMTSEAD